MEPPRKKRKLTAKKQALSVLPRLPSELRMMVLTHLLPVEPIRLRWNIQSIKSAVLKISETDAPKFWDCARLNDDIATNVVDVLRPLFTVDFKFDKKGVLHGAGLTWNVSCDIEEAVEDLKGIKEIELTLPRLERKYETMDLVPQLANGTSKYEAEIAHFVQLLNNLPLLQILTIHVPMAGPYIAMLSSTKPQHGYVLEHFAEILEPFRAVHGCKIGIEPRQSNDPRFVLQARCPEAFELLQDFIETINSPTNT
ncbi:hypothetical protein Vi05172_g5568 [Venturia inaequalis]|nr:hypothetical protein Vi05172_g5568 [Venturia inaequalis]